jgi:adenylate cyclase
MGGALVAQGMQTMSSKIAAEAATRSHAVLLVDSEPRASALLVERIAARGHRAAVVPPTAEALRERLRFDRFDVVIFDFHSERPHELEACRLARSDAGGAPIIVLAASGVPMQQVEDFRSRSGAIDEIVRKPVAGDAIFRLLGHLVSRRASDHRAGLYASLVSEGGRSWIDSGGTRAQLSEQAVLFTDIRRSTELVSSVPLPEWFEAINRGLSDQGAIVRESGGSIVKFTGDGLLAAFSGRGRSHLALRCALALQRLDRTAPYRDTLRVGMGVAEGLVMSGLIGEPGRQQYDVIGATVHLAARLCSIANEGEIVATPKLVRAAAVTRAHAQPTRAVNLRGFPAPIECVSF